MNVEEVFEAWKEGGANIRHCRIPDFLVFFSFVGLWGGWLVWRGRVGANLLEVNVRKVRYRR